ncbi:RNA-directed DNA polymerase, eukaryota [Tanacetum coccineum]
MAASSLVCLMSKATSTKSWLWHRRLSHLNFGTINHLTKHDLVDGLPRFKSDKDHLCFACEQEKSKKATFPPKLIPSTTSKLELLHIDLCGPMRVETVNGKRYIVIVDDYSRYTWVYFLRIKDDTPEMIIKSRRSMFERLNPSQTFKSKEDELAKLSLSVYVANFPSHLTVRELWNVCGKVGTLADVYIAKRKNHLGKMFAFCRYIKVANSKTLIDSLSNVWIGKLRLHANVAKFDQNMSKVPSHAGVKVGNDSQPNKAFSNGVMNKDAAKSSFASVLNVGRNPKPIMDSPPPVVLGDDCLLEHDFSCTLMGKIKDINALSNLYVILANEGFDKVNLSDECLVWISIEGLPIKTWTHNTFAKIVSPWGVMADVDTDADDPALPFKKLCVVTKTHTIINDMIKVLLKGCVLWLRVKELEARSPDFSNDDSDNSSSDEESVNEEHDNGVELKKHGTSNAPRPIFEDPFGIYDLLNKNAAKQDSKGDDPIFPPGFTPDAINDTEVENIDDSVNKHIGGSILDVMEGLVEVGQTMGFNMEGCLKNIEAIISAQGDCQYDYAYSPSVGYSGGLLCIWDPNMFSKDSVTISDSFVAIRGMWNSSSTKLLIVSVYAPQDLSERKTLWEYISHLIDQWDGECVILGDFNEVRSEQERFGSNFNASGANAFNQFISSADLVDLPLEGYSFTWAHKSASKMSKLDRFLVTEGLLSVFPSLSAICLDRHLSDHRPILMRELVVDYGPTPFRVFHSWFIKDGFEKLVEDSWKNSTFVEANNISLLKKNSKLLRCRSKTGVKLISSERAHKRSSIRGVLVDGDWIEEPSKVKNEFLTHFSNLFSKPTGPSIKLDPQMFRRLSIEQNVELESNVSYEEIKKAVWDCGSNKSPGPDGFTFDFICKYWKIIHQDVVNAVQEFFVSSKFPPGCNSSFITLIPKKQDAKGAVSLWLQEKGGLGVSSFFALNQALLFKWIWRFISHGTSLWSRVIKAIYGDHGALNNPGAGSRSSLWYNIIREIGSLSNKGINFLSHMKKKVGNGVYTSFWEEPWLSNIPLMNVFPRLYALENNKQVTVAAKLSDGFVTDSFRRTPRGGIEEEQLPYYRFIILNRFVLADSMLMIWLLDSSGVSSSVKVALVLI